MRAGRTLLRPAGCTRADEAKGDSRPVRGRCLQYLGGPSEGCAEPAPSLRPSGSECARRARLGGSEESAGPPSGIPRRRATGPRRHDRMGPRFPPDLQGAPRRCRRRPTQRPRVRDEGGRPLRCAAQGGEGADPTTALRLTLKGYLAAGPMDAGAKREHRVDRARRPASPRSARATPLLHPVDSAPLRAVPGCRPRRGAVRVPVEPCRPRRPPRRLRDHGCGAPLPHSSARVI